MKINIKINKLYNEMEQVNPIRWKTLFKEEDGSFSDQSGWIKCKDFYNDTVAFFKEGSVFSLYGYENNIKKNDEGVHFLLKYIKDTGSFIENLHVMNTQMMEDLGCCVLASVYSKDEVTCLIPTKLWDSTYHISMVTMCIRLCNYGVQYTCWQDFWDAKSPAVTLDKAFDGDALANAKTMGFKLPEMFKDYWFYAGPQYNSKVTPKQKGGIVHNNGVCQWSMWMKKAMVCN